MATERDVSKTLPSTEQQAAEQSGNLPPLHPIFERLFLAVNEQQAAERLRKNPPPELPAFPPRGERALVIQQDPGALEKFKRRQASQAEWMRNYCRRKKEAQMSEQPGASPDPSVTPPAPESPAPDRLRSTKGRRNP
jgi:hypothetical protein